MTKITTTHNITEDLANVGYSLIRATELSIPGELRQSWLSLSIDYADLPPDEYLPDNGKYRFRRYGRFYFVPTSEELLRLPHEGYFQDTDINAVTGGIVRKFAPLLDTTFENEFLHELIRFDFRNLPVDDTLKSDPWDVHVHLVRVTANADINGHPTPEGIHKDGAEFVTVHLAELVNADGGDVSIYDNDKNLLSTHRLNQVMDFYIFNDDMLWHSADPITPKNGTHQAIRSILTFDYHHSPNLARPV
jgi:hypothetical protein